MRESLARRRRTVLSSAAAMSVAMGSWALVEAVGARIPRDYSSFQVVWVRYGIHLGLVFLIFGRHGTKRMIRTRRPALQVLRSALMVGMPAFFIWIPDVGPIADAWPAFWLAPLLVVGLSGPLLDERPGRHRWLATGLGLFGTFAVLGTSSPPLGAAALLALASGACFGLYCVLTRRLMDETLQSRLFYTATVPFGAFAPVMLFRWHPLTARVFLLMTLVGLGGLVTLWALDKALDLAPASLVAVFMFFNVLAEVGLHVVAGEMPGRRGAIGALTILAAGAWVVFVEARRGDGA